jgi:hypothetical protein
MEIFSKIDPPPLRDYDAQCENGTWYWFHTDAPAGSTVPRAGKHRF